jgi:hypothetical protein
VIIFAAISTLSVGCSKTSTPNERSSLNLNAASSPTPDPNKELDTSAKSLPEGFEGHSAPALCSRLGSLQTVRSKGKDEFETTKDYEERVRQKESQPLMGNLTLQSRYALQMETSITYDADKQVLTASLPCNVYGSRCDSLEIDKYNDGTFLGDTYVVEKEHHIYIKFHENVDQLRPLALPLDNTTAKKKKEEKTVRALILCTLDVPYMEKKNFKIYDVPVEEYTLFVTIQEI